MRADTALPATSAAAVDSREEAGRVARAAPTPASLPEPAQLDVEAESYWTLVWAEEDLDDRLESREGKLGEGVRGRNLSQLFFIGEIEP
jgi:hypothetical protein